MGKGIQEDLLSDLKALFLKRTPVSEAIHNTMMSYLREYLALGKEWPEVLANFMEPSGFCESQIKYKKSF